MKIVFCGDIVLTKRIEKAIEDGLLKEEFKAIRAIFKNADLVIGNLECPFTDEDKPAFTNQFTHKADKKAGRIIGDLCIDLVSLANNHILDFGKKGLRDTIDVLEMQNIRWLGAGWSEEEARKPIEVMVKDRKVGILSLAQKECSAANIKGWGAGVLDDDYAIETVRCLKRNADIVIAYFHFGIEFARYPTPQQIKLCHVLIEQGADIIIGHHPHVPQGFEFYKKGFIAYSLGNFIFEMPRGSHKFDRLGLIVEIDIAKNTNKKVQITPFDTNNGFPERLVGIEKDEAFNFLDELTEPILDKNALLKEYYFICRDNFYLLWDDLLTYAIIRGNISRGIAIIKSQFWPQVLKLRIDLIRFIVTGHAYFYEKSKGKTNLGIAKIYRSVCSIFYFFSINFNWITKKISSANSSRTKW